MGGGGCYPHHVDNHMPSLEDLHFLKMDAVRTEFIMTEGKLVQVCIKK